MSFRLSVFGCPLSVVSAQPDHQDIAGSSIDAQSRETKPWDFTKSLTIEWIVWNLMHKAINSLTNFGDLLRKTKPWNFATSLINGALV